MTIFLYIFILVDVFAVGVLASEAVRHMYAHLTHQPENGKHGGPTTPIPPAVKQKMLEESEEEFKRILNHSAKQLQGDLEATGGEINKQVSRIASEIVAGEIERYKQDFAKLHEETSHELGGVSEELAARQAELKAKLAEDMAAEKDLLIKQIDTKLADAVTAFLLETLQHDVDLGSQTSYLLSTLEEHKAEFTKGVTDEA